MSEITEQWLTRAAKAGVAGSAGAACPSCWRPRRFAGDVGATCCPFGEDYTPEEALAALGLGEAAGFSIERYDSKAWRT